MRLKIKLKGMVGEIINLNYNYLLSSAIYKLLHLGSPEFSEFLHNTGYKTDGKSYKLFTFALKFEDTSIEKQFLKLNSPFAYLYISSPLIEDFVKNFVIGTFEANTIELMSNYTFAKFTINQAECIPEPEYKNNMQFNLMSPLVLSTGITRDNKLTQYYFRYNDDIEEINRVFEKNIKNKYAAITNTAYQGEGLKLKWDEEYIQRAERKGKRLSKKVSIYKDVKNPIDIVGIFCPFLLEGDIDLIRTGYECGFGEKNSMGFGMTDTNFTN